jgi:cytochrome c
MRRWRSAPEIGLGICGAIVAAEFATAQISPPPAKPPDGAALFKQQCATCHTTNLSDPQRQGPSLFKLTGRRPARVSRPH